MEFSDAAQLKAAVTYCRSPQFLFQACFVCGSTGKVLQGKIEAARLRIQDDAQGEETLCKSVIPDTSAMLDLKVMALSSPED